MNSEIPWLSCTGSCGDDPAFKIKPISHDCLPLSELLIRIDNYPEKWMNLLFPFIYNPLCHSSIFHLFLEFSTLSFMLIMCKCEVHFFWVAFAPFSCGITLSMLLFAPFFCGMGSHGVCC